MGATVLVVALAGWWMAGGDGKGAQSDVAVPTPPGATAGTRSGGAPDSTSPEPTGDASEPATRVPELEGRPDLGSFACVHDARPTDCVRAGVSPPVGELTGPALAGGPGIVDGEVVVVGWGGTPESGGPVGGSRGAVYALRIVPGTSAFEPLWSAPTETAVTTPPVVHDGLVYAADVGGRMYVHEATGGERLRSIPLPAPAVGRPVPADGWLVLPLAGPAGRTLRVLDIATGTVEGGVPAAGPVVSFAAATGAPLVYVSDATGTHAHDLDLDTEQEVWRAADGYLATAGSPPGGTVYVAEPDGHLTARDPASGEVRWAVDLPGIHWPPVAGDGVVHVLDDTGTVTSLAADTGARRGAVGIASSPLRGRGRSVPGGVLLPTRDGLLAASTTDGTRGSFPVGHPQTRQINGVATTGSGIVVTTSHHGLFLLDPAAFTGR